MTHLVYDSAAWTGRHGPAADVTAMTLGQTLIADLGDKPLRVVPAAFISGDAVLSLTAGLATNNWLAVGSAVGVISGGALAIGGDGGDPATRTPSEISRAAFYEKIAFAAVGIQGVSFVGSGMFSHDGGISFSEITVGLLCAGGAAAGRFCATPAQPASVGQVTRQAIEGRFRQAAHSIGQLQPYEKAGLLWLVSQVPLAIAGAELGLQGHGATAAGYFAAISLYILGNVQTMRSWRAELVKNILPAQTL